MLNEAKLFKSTARQGGIEEGAPAEFMAKRERESSKRVRHFGSHIWQLARGKNRGLKFNVAADRGFNGTRRCG